MKALKMATAVIILAGLTAYGQATVSSPTEGQVIVTPDTLKVLIVENGTNVSMTTISLWRYDRPPYRTNEVPTLLASITASNSLAYCINFTNPPFSEYGCGDYLVKAQYLDPATTNDSTAVSGKFRVLMDVPRIRIDYPNPWSIFVRGQTYRIVWETLAKPGQTVANTVGLLTPDGYYYGDSPSFDLTGGIGTTNQTLDWTVPTNTVTEDEYPFPDGQYQLIVADDDSQAMAQAPFGIDAAATVPATLVWTNLPYPPRTGWQVVGQPDRGWWVQTSTNLVDWQQLGNVLPDGNGDLIPFANDGNPQKFYRLMLAQ